MLLVTFGSKLPSIDTLTFRNWGDIRAFRGVLRPDVGGGVRRLGVRESDGMQVEGFVRRLWRF